MPGRSRLNANVIDTEQVYDDSISYAKLNTACKASIASLDTAAIASALAAAKVADKTVVKYLSVSLYATGTVVYPICTVPSMSTVTRVLTVCEASRVGASGTIDIGDASAASGYLANANIGKTLNDITGDDPALYGAYLWVPGVQTKTASSWAVTALHVDGTSHDMTTSTQGSTAGDWTVTTWGHPRTKTYLTDTVINATVVKGDNSAGTMGIYVFYEKVVAST